MNLRLQSILGQYYRDTLFAALALAILIAGGAYLWYATQVDADVRTTRTRTAAVQTQADTLERNMRGNLTRLKTEQETIASAKAQLRSPDALNAGIVQTLELATSSGLQVDRVEPGESTRDRLVRVPITLNGTGTYPSVVLMLRALDRQMPCVTVQAVQVRAVDQGRATYQLKLVWHALPTSVSPLASATEGQP
jgi:Tfp pilus assembly protein PilO